MKKRILILGVFAFLICINKVSALEVGQKLKDGQIIESVNDIDISIKGRKSNLQNFLSNKWRTYVKLDDLCSSSIDVCKVDEINNKQIILTKNYENTDDVYYKTAYTYSNNTYKSLLIVPNSLDFSFGDTMTSVDVKPVEVDNELYVPIRFISESLGAEVIYENKENTNPTVTIDFYSNMSLDFEVEFYDVNSIKNNDYSTMEKYDFKDLKKNGCYDIVVKIGDKTTHNPKIFSKNEKFIKIDYNDNVQTNICLNSNPSSKSLSFVFNYNGVPLLYDVDENTIKNPTLDKLYLTGDTTGISKDNEVKLEAQYVGDKTNFNKYSTLKWQGHSSLAYDKKNYTIKLYNDSEYTNKYKFSVSNWRKRNKYCLKANYIDYTQSRNIISAKLWGEVVNSRSNLNENLEGLVNGGAIDGYPILLYINNEYQGLYTFNTCKDEDLFTNGNEPMVVYAANHFTEDIWFSNENSHNNTGKTLEQWDLEFLSDNVSEDEMNNSLQEMVTFVFNSSDDELKKSLNKYLDVNAAIDYMLFMYYINGSDNASINTLWTTYDGNIWIPSAYDMDATFGLGATGRKYLDYNYMFPSKNNNYISSNTDMILWDRLLNVYTDEVKERYNYLRKNILTSSNVTKKLKNIINSIPDEEYLNDFNLWDKTTTINNEKMVTWQNDNDNMSLIDNEMNKIIEYIKQREIKLDEIIDSL